MLVCVSVFGSRVWHQQRTKKKEKKEVKILGVTQAIEMEINVVNHDKTEHFHYRKNLSNEVFFRSRSFYSFYGF